MTQTPSVNQNSSQSLGMSEISSSTLDQKMSQWFLRFSEQASGSAMYAFLSKEVAKDHDLIVLAAHADPKQPAPNLFFAAIHFLLMKHPHEKLAEFYPSLGGSFIESKELFDAFKKFCTQFSGEIQQLLKTRLVQTNEVQRCALLFPAMSLIAKYNHYPNMAVVDVGASGGLNLLMDKAYIKYSDGCAFVLQDSALHISCESKGNRVPDYKPARIATRIGVDLNTVNLLNESERQWNLALIWPDQVERLERVKTALRVLEKTTIVFRQGNANHILPQVISEVPHDQLLCVMHSFTLNQFSKEDREAFDLMLAEESNKREIWRISLEWIGTQNPELVVIQYKSGSKVQSQKLADCQGHGEWICWNGEFQ